MGVLVLWTLFLAVLFIQGCSSSSPPPDPAPPAKNVFNPLTQQIDKARAVQQTVDQNADSTRKSIDAQERGDSPQ
jgi:hypothetical protein